MHCVVCRNEEGVEQEYVWIHSAALQKLRAAHARLDRAAQAGQACSANEQLLAQVRLRTLLCICSHLYTTVVS
jgi:cell division FtsZ-interacting protein ZapD